MIAAAAGFGDGSLTIMVGGRSLAPLYVKKSRTRVP
jgi:hypothetical protein